MKTRLALSWGLVVLYSAPSVAGEESRRVPLARLFVAPSAQILESAALHLSAGGVFTTEQEGGLLGLARLGLGNIGEVELTTLSVTSNTSIGTISVPTTALKFKILPDRLRASHSLPYLAMVFKGSNWTNVKGNPDVIRFNEQFAHYGITDVTYDSRFTSLFLLASVAGIDGRIHFGPILTDFRHRDLEVATIDTFFRRDDEVSQSIVGGFIGFVADANPASQIILELETLPRLKFRPATNEVVITNDVLMVGGIRFFATDYVSIDAAVRYLNSFDGLADLQLRLAANLNFPIKRLAERAGDRPR